MGGPISDIEYYWADPTAKYLSGKHAFYPLNFYKGETNDLVGELTTQGKRRFWSGDLLNPPNGQFYSGNPRDFAGKTNYPGPPGAGDLPDCVNVRVEDDDVFEMTDDDESGWRYRVYDPFAMDDDQEYRLAGPEHDVYEMADDESYRLAVPEIDPFVMRDFDTHSISNHPGPIIFG